MSEDVKTADLKLTVSPAPHIRSAVSVPKIMWTVNLALLPAALFGVYLFGIHALLIMAVGVVSAVGAEYVYEICMKKPVTVKDGSAFTTGLLLAMCLPPGLPLYMVSLGSIFAIIIAKHSMGGIGYNIFNPAHIGRAALMACWPAAMTTWNNFTYSTSNIDSVSSATALNIVKQEGYSSLISLYGSQAELYKSFFIGTRLGSIGETSTLFLLVGAAVLIYFKYIKWQLPVIFIGTVGVCMWMLGTPSSAFFTGDPIFNMMAGGLIIGAFFMATDMVTIPLTMKGQIIFAVGCGIITSLIRRYGGYPEGVCYAILIMNCLTPIIDRYTQPVRFGARRPENGK